MTMREDWIKEAKQNGANYIIAAGDSFDNSYYPVYCKDLQEVSIQKLRILSQDMSHVHEVIDMSKES